MLEKRGLHRVRAWGRVASGALLSQVSSFLSILLLVGLGPKWADAYSIAIQAGLASFSGIVLGILYNLVLGRPHFTHWRRWAVIAAVASGLYAGTVGFASADGEGDWTARSLLLLYGTGGAILGIAGVGGVRAALLGHASVLSMMTVPPNVGQLVCLLPLVLVTGSTDLALPPWLLIVPAVGWACGCAVSLRLSRKWHRADPPELAAASGPAADEARPPADEALAQTVALGVGLISSTVLPLLALVALSRLPAGSVALAFLLYRVGNSLVVLGINSFLLGVYRWGRQYRLPARLVLASSAATVALLAVSLGYHLVGPRGGESTIEWISIGAGAAGWFTAAAGSIFVSRASNALRQGRGLLLKVAIDVLVCLVMLALLWSRPTVQGYFFLAAASQLAALVALGRGVGFRSVSWAGAAAMAFVVVCGVVIAVV